MPLASSTVIGSGVRLILMDCFDTLVQLKDGRYWARQGVMEFLGHFGKSKSIPIAVISDATQVAVSEALRQSGVLPFISGLYHVDNSSVTLADGRQRKRLSVALNDFAVSPAEAVFIGDSPLDAEAARLAEVPFIRVPRGEDTSFSFARLIRGPSRYDSQEFFMCVQEAWSLPPAPGGKSGPG